MEFYSTPTILGVAPLWRTQALNFVILLLLYFNSNIVNMECYTHLKPSI